MYVVSAALAPFCPPPRKRDIRGEELSAPPTASEDSTTAGEALQTWLSRGYRRKLDHW